jgi:hypothetical protein
MIPLIEIQTEKRPSHPVVRLSETAPGSIWQYTGACIATEDLRGRPRHDLNRAAEIAATALAEKVSARNITVELVIDPLIPPLSVANERILPIVTALAENASASVEPGPGVVMLRTWLADKFAGVDAVGMNGYLPSAIRENLTRPGFSTRVADWDTGFGLHAAMEAAVAIAARIELFEPDGSIGFRLAIPVKQGNPLGPSEIQTGLVEKETTTGGVILTNPEELSYQLLANLWSDQNVFTDGAIQA